MSVTLIYIIIGLSSGIISGLVGIGGALILIPAFTFLLGFSQLQAQGTSLAVLLPPIGVLAVLTYYKRGVVDLRVAGFVCLGFVFGALLGSQVAVKLSTHILQKLFAIFMITMGIYMLFKDKILK